jgi:hypothetical protein
MIVKIQLSLYTSSTAIRTMLIHDKHKVYLDEGRATAYVLQAMGRKSLAYFEARVDALGKLHIIKETESQGW